jgi:hypothetical protein
MDLERLPHLGLAALMLLAGASKFLMPALWTGFEPRILVELLGISSTQLMLAGGSLEIALGITLIRPETRKISALITAAWLAAITLRTVQLGAYSIAIRDFGLVIYAATVYLIERK